MADETEQQTAELIAALRDAGKSLRSIAEELNNRGLTPKAGARWYPTQVARVLARR